MPHVTSVEDPYATKGAITPDGRTLVARVYLDVTNPNDMPVEDTKKLLAAAKAAERDGLNIALGGRAVQLAEANQSGSEMIGLIAAARDPADHVRFCGGGRAAHWPWRSAGWRSVPAWSASRRPRWTCPRSRPSSA